MTDTTENQVSGSAAGLTTSFFLSTDTTWSPEDLFLGSRTVSSLAPGATSSGTTGLTIPAGMTPGTYYILAKADADAAVAEGHEGNNVKHKTIAIKLVTTARRRGDDGENLLTSCTGVTNLGTVAPPAVNPTDDSGVCAPAAPEPVYP